MSQYPQQKPSNDETQALQFDEFLTPEQRLDAVAEILASIADRVIKKRRQRQE